MYNKKKLNRIVEATRQALNSTPIEEHVDILNISFQMARKYSVCIDRQWFFRHLQTAGLKGITYKPLYRDNRKELYGALWFYEDDTPKDLLEEQTGLTPAYLPMIEEWQKRRKERKALERAMASPCYNCEGEDCPCCCHRDIRYPGMAFSYPMEEAWRVWS